MNRDIDSGPKYEPGEDLGGIFPCTVNKTAAETNFHTQVP